MTQALYRGLSVSLFCFVSVFFFGGEVGGLLAQEDSVAAGSLPVCWIEDFENGDKAWQTTDDHAWTIKTEAQNSFLALTQRVSDYQPAVRSPHNIALHKGPEVGDFELTFKVRSTQDTGPHRDCCVFFGYRDPSHFYYVHLGAKPDPHSGQIMIVNGEPRKALTENTNETPWTAGWHKVRLVRDVAAGTIEVYFDDMKTQHMSVTDKTFNSGRVGLGSFDDLVEFDDVVLKAHSK